MQRTITEQLKDAILAINLPWFDRVCGMVEPLTQKVVSGTGTVNKTFPVYREPNQTGCKKSNNYTACHPDTALKSLIYMEPGEANMEANTTHYTEYNMPVNIILWTNLKQLNPAYENASDFADELMGDMPEVLLNTGAYNTIRVAVNNCSRDAGVVNKYSYDEAESQQWIYPFDFIVINLTVRFRRVRNCHGNILVDPSSCKNYG